MYSAFMIYLYRPYAIPILFTSLSLFMFTTVMLVGGCLYFLGEPVALTGEGETYGRYAAMVSGTNILISLAALYFGYKYFVEGIRNILQGCIWYVLVMVMIGVRTAFKPDILKSAQPQIIMLIITAAVLIAIALLSQREGRDSL